MFSNFSVGCLARPASDLIQAANNAGGAVLVYSKNDEIVWANDAQRALMPCSDYVDETYSSIFWKVFEAGFSGAKLAKDDPVSWLEGAIVSRNNSQNLDFINEYFWGRMLVSHIRLDDGVSVQARIDLKKSGLENYFRGETAGLGIMWALQMQRDITNLQSALDGLAIAVGLVDGDGRILHKNTSFSDMLSACDGLYQSEDNIILAVDVCDDMVVKQSIKNVTGGLLDSSFAPLRRATAPPLVMAVTAGDVPGTAVLAVSRFGEDHESLVAGIRQALGITPAEAAVIAGIGVGQSVAEIAVARNVTEKTTRNQVQSLRRALEGSRFAVGDLAGIASLVTKIAAITRPIKGQLN
ncbi:hypothetical protein [Azospirillum sp.]|uniref:helix-turn-helix transcriptional regulator n=1 Tax=Azospirillum sp. TaxID=34012 RepID=UPI002631BFC2|nr:hypothetical protein [Azospirillum sp.]